eukprot:694831-Amphidinium_carterae.1
MCIRDSPSTAPNPREEARKAYNIVPLGARCFFFFFRAAVQASSRKSESQSKLLREALAGLPHRP